MPEELEDADLVENITEARSYLEQEALRTKTATSTDPASSKTSLEKLGFKTLKDKFPFLAEYSDSFIMEAGVHNLIKAEKAARQLKDMDRNNKAEDKLFSNRETVDSVLYPIEAGKDNRLSTLHAARCLPGAVCSAAKLWLHARTIMGNKGHPPLSSYDMQSIGMGGTVSAKGWVELHDPSSSNLSIKQFSMGGGLSSKGGKDNLIQDMEDLTEFRNSLRTLRGAMSFVHPWNHSITALESFFNHSNFCAKDLASSDKQVNLLVKFTDYVLNENASRWRDMEGFLTTREIRGVWADFLNQNPPTKSKPQQAQHKSQQHSQHQPHNSSSSGASVKSGAAKQYNKLPSYLFMEDICVMWNLGRCVKSPGSCVNKRGQQLRHVCNHRPDPAKPHESCGKNHPACNFH